MHGGARQRGARAAAHRRQRWWAAELEVEGDGWPGWNGILGGVCDMDMG